MLVDALPVRPRTRVRFPPPPLSLTLLLSTEAIPIETVSADRLGDVLNTATASDRSWSRRIVSMLPIARMALSSPMRHRAFLVALALVAAALVPAGAAPDAAGGGFGNG